MFKKLPFAVAALAASTLLAVGGTAFADTARHPDGHAPTLTTPEAALAKIRAQDRHFAEAHVVSPAPGVFTALGFHGATTSMIVGEKGVVMIDSLMGPESAGRALAELRRASGTTAESHPVLAVVYTHGHGDHTGGAAAYAAENPSAAVRVFGPKGLGDDSGGDPAVKKHLMARGVMQFGRQLPAADRTNRGIAPAVTMDADRAKGFMKPTDVVDGAADVTIAGIRMHLEQSPGETPEAMFVWLPDSRVLFTGDNFYQAFPNLYAIRGTPYRDPREWAASNRRMAALRPAVVIPGHTSPITGEAEATGALADYARAIEEVFHQTAEGMNRMEDPETIARNVRLPDDLAGKPWLSEVYGTLENASRAVYAGLVGWYDGNPVHLHPLPLADRAKRTAELAGGLAKALEALESASRGGTTRDMQWTLELAETLRHHPALDEAGRSAVRNARIGALRALGAHESNPLNRNYYFSFSNTLEKNGRSD